MTKAQRDLETATWGVAVVDAEVKLFLLALVRTNDLQLARELSGLDESDAGSAEGWLRQVGVLAADGTIDADRLREADTRKERLTALAA